ncbi:efflux RND transporter periplasmic adaptor subunit [Prosthecobacter vanneervenii]|uniref:RND family efflux transporter MFP subunit n=1 Tax=Prosthecobacter vanneervenii TaxID=48466 RepID=A0A7W8DJ93_9BACT|nr:efflux RND transporter periplasmic adaptor subunit [Prosthecobacter vanneervenii]MBB5031908.1 RND family efflux transporter MFP subunit [Prosthecobacter vanneervenii]
MKKAKPSKKIIITAGVCALAVAGWWSMSDGGSKTEKVPTFIVQRGPLEINVLQGGEIRALQNYEVKSEIEIPTKILNLIPEGYMITEEDVKDGKVLIELDNTDVKSKIETHEIEFQTTVSSYIEADENREIQRSENQTLVRDMKQVAMFALMDFEKYLGRDVTASILKAAKLPADVEAFEKYADTLETQANSTPNSEAMIAKKEKEAGEKDDAPAVKKTLAAMPPSEMIDFSPFLEQKGESDGEAQQKLRQLEDDMLLHRSELALAKQKVESTKRLAAKKFVTATLLENDEVSLDKVELSVKTSETALALYKKYEFSKQCATFLAAYREALNKLQRTIRANRSRMAQAETRFTTAKRRYEMELARRENLEQQLKACVIKAPQAGLVAYGDLNASASYNYNNSIEEGATVRLRQTLLTIPDMSQMGVRVNVHESQIKKVKIGQPVKVRVDAEPGKELDGRVAELAVLPDSSSSRYTPNLKVYPCTIHINGYHPWMKPGMNAKVEIIVNQLADVLYVPVQSIEVEQDHHYCYVNKNGTLERREVSTGLFNDEFIEVRNGLQGGEAVALALPKKAETDMGGQQPSSKPHEPDGGGGKGKAAKAKEKDVAMTKS